MPNTSPMYLYPRGCGRAAIASAYDSSSRCAMYAAMMTSRMATKISCSVSAAHGTTRVSSARQPAHGLEEDLHQLCSTRNLLGTSMTRIVLSALALTSTLPDGEKRNAVGGKLCASRILTIGYQAGRMSGSLGTSLSPSAHA